MSTISQKTELPHQVEEWTQEHVHYWLTEVIQVDKKHADRLYEEEVSGKELTCYQPTHLQDLGIKQGPAVRIITKFNELKHTHLRHSCSLYPFDHNFESHRYIENYTLPPETGPGNLIDPVHEYKFMGRTNNIDVMKKKFNKEVFRFAAGCMNSRTNGTIHFGVADSKSFEYAHGEIIGICVEKKDIFIDHFDQGIKSYFQDHTGDANACIRQPRFVEVLCPNGTLSGKYVIEVDVVPSHSVVQGKLFYIQTLDEDNQWKKSKTNSLFIREGAATRDICKIGNPKELQCEMSQINAQLNVLDKRRKEGEKRPESKSTSNHGEQLKNLLTCGKDMFGHYNYYIIVTNKSHPEQLQHLQFMTALKPFCVLDFDPNSAVDGLCHNYSNVQMQTANLHKPSQFSGDPKTVVKTLNLDKKTSWVFCNGREDLNTESDRPLQPSEWLTNKAKEVHDMISFLCNSNTLQRERLLVIFLLLSAAEAMNDPIFDTFMTFYINLEGAKNILNICTTNASFQKWRDFIQARCEHDISLRSIYNLELSEINGTILKLGQNKSNAQRFLPSSEGSLVVLQQKDKDIMTSLEVLCENECENIFDESSAEFKNFKMKTVTDFYRGGKVKWWNFYFSEQTDAKPFIKREMYSTLEKMIRSKTKDPKSPYVKVNLFHHPGCGGTTMAMHVMWNLRKEFRCAVLKDNSISKEVPAQHVAHLMQCGKNEQSFKTPVLLLVDDFEETENTKELQHSLRKITGETGTTVIILNCIRTNLPEVRYKESVIDSVFIEAAMIDKEKCAFDKKLKELQEIKSFKTDNFYSFMILKSNFDPEYVSNVAIKILKKFKYEHKQDELFCIIALMNSYVAKPAMSYSLCETFLGITKPILGDKKPVLQEMKDYSSLLIESEENGLKSIGFVHQHLAIECFKQIEETHQCSKADLVLGMLKRDLLFKSYPAKHDFSELLKRMLAPNTESDEKDTLFTPLINDINSKKDGPKKIQKIFELALKRFHKDVTTSRTLEKNLASYLLRSEPCFAQAKFKFNQTKNN